MDPLGYPVPPDAEHALTMQPSSYPGPRFLDPAASTHFPSSPRTVTVESLQDPGLPELQGLHGIGAPAGAAPANADARFGPRELSCRQATSAGRCGAVCPMGHRVGEGAYHEETACGDANAALAEPKAGPLGGTSMGPEAVVPVPTRTTAAREPGPGFLEAGSEATGTVCQHAGAGSLKFVAGNSPRSGCRPADDQMPGSIDDAELERDVKRGVKASTVVPLDSNPRRRSQAEPHPEAAAAVEEGNRVHEMSCGLVSHCPRRPPCVFPVRLLSFDQPLSSLC